MDSFNPFSAKAQRARALYNRLAGTSSAHDRGMAEAFPLGAGFGRGSQRSRDRAIDATVNRAGKIVAALKEAQYQEAREKAFAEGKINAQGRRIDAASIARSDKAYAAKEKREAKIAAAKAEVDEKGRENVSPETWATAGGYLAGGARALVMSDQEEFLAKLGGKS